MCRQYFFIAVASIFITIFSSSLLAEDKAPEKKKKKRKTIVVKAIKDRKYKLIPLKSIDFETVQSACKPLMSDKGLLIQEKKRNAILVYDYPEVIEKIQQFLKEADRTAVNIRVDVDFLGNKSVRKTGFSARPDYGRGPEAPKIIIKDGKMVKPKSWTFKGPGIQKRSSTRNTSQFITTRSGYPANIFVGKTLVDPQWINNAILNPTVVITNRRGGGAIIIPGNEVDMKMTATGAWMEVLPRYLDNGLIDVEVYPVVSYLDGKGRREAVKVESVSTHVQVRDGQRIYIGGLLGAKKKDYFSLFGPDFFRSEDGTDALDMYLTATIIKPGSGGRRKVFPRHR